VRFGGHETFPIREGWLHKGLKTATEHPERFGDEHVADWLGVGKNMSRSIRHWLEATGLAEAPEGKRSRRKVRLDPTELGRIVREHDPYFLEPGTWWALHANLVGNSRQAVTWAWFFNGFHQTRFEKAVCLENLRRHLRLTFKRMPSERTLDRDLGCLLASYSRKIPPTNEDPEESRDCPFMELGLLSYFRTSGYYELNVGAKSVPPEIVGYALAKAFPDARAGDGRLDVTIHEASQVPGGPGRAFALPTEALFETVLRAEETRGEPEIEITGLAGERVIRVARRTPEEWLSRYYEAARKEARRVA